MHSIECALAAPFAQHAWSPANALDAASIAATKAVLMILIMVTCRYARPKNCSICFFDPVILSEAKNFRFFSGNAKVIARDF
jgi:hypothetical protein